VGSGNQVSCLWFPADLPFLLSSSLMRGSPVQALMPHLFPLDSLNGVTQPAGLAYLSPMPPQTLHPSPPQLSYLSHLLSLLEMNCVNNFFF
jgi:hypothetical protein